MSLGGIFVGWILCILHPAQEPNESVNLLRNPSFEHAVDAKQAPSDWQSMGGVWRIEVSPDARDGESVLACASDGHALLRQFLRWKSASPQALRFEASLRATQDLEVRLRAESIDGRVLKRSSLIVAPSQTWRNQSIQMKVPQGTDRIRLEILSHGRAELDELKLQRTPFEAPSWAELVQQLENGQPGSDSRTAAIRLLAELEHNEAHDWLLEFARTAQDPTERAQSWASLASMGPQGRALLWKELEQGADREVLRALARERDVDLLARLPQLLPDPLDADGAELIEAVAAEYPLEQVFPSLLAPQLEASAPAIAQDAALQVLSDRGDQRFFAGLDVVYPRASAERRARWLAASARFDGAAALEELAKYVRRARGLDRDPAERAFLRAARSMESLESRTWLLKQGLSHRDAFIRRASLLALGPDFEPIEIAAALSLVRDSDTEVLRALIPILADHPSSASGKALQELISHRVAAVAADALMGFWQLRQGDASARTLCEGLATREGHAIVQAAAISLLAEETRALSQARLNEMVVQAEDWRVRRAAGQVLRKRGLPLPAEASLGPDVPVSAYLVALSSKHIEQGVPQAVGPWLQLRERIAEAREGQDVIWTAALKPKELPIPYALAAQDRVSAFDRWFLQQSQQPGAGSLGGLRSAIEEACKMQDAVELILVLDTELPEAELADWFDLLADLQRLNRHQAMQVLLLGPELPGRLEPVFGAYREASPSAPIGQ